MDVSVSGSIRKDKGLESGQFLVRIVAPGCGFRHYVMAGKDVLVGDLRREVLGLVRADTTRQEGRAEQQGREMGYDWECTTLSHMGRLMGDVHSLRCYGVSQDSLVTLNRAHEDSDFCQQAAIAILAIRRRKDLRTLLHTSPREMTQLIARAVLDSRHSRKWALLRLQRPHVAVETNNVALLKGTLKQSNHLLDPEKVQRLIRRASACTCGNNQPVLGWLQGHLRDL